MPDRVTEYEHDSDGRVIRSVEWVESAWDEQQRAWMLALAEYDANTCPHCGGPSEVCQSKDADRNNPRAQWIYWPVSPAECAVTTAMRLHKQDPDEARALIPRVVRVRRGSPRPTL